ncbi:MAG: hypothetical protein M3R32_06500 [Chloroflexota bacterium]|nr:hypothetical protein [Chloroflexota bacterium]
MTNSALEAPDSGELGDRLRAAAPAILLLLLVAGATLVPSGIDPGLRLASPDRSHVDQLRASITRLPRGALVLVAFDADLGTYPEIRAATRAAMADLAAHGARLAIVSFTPEGRAIAVAERDRIARAGGADPPADLGFVAGSEAGMVRAIASVVPAAAAGPTVDAIRQGGGGIGAFDLVLIVSGSDISARSWVEQVGSRLPAVPLVAIAPTFLDPELEPYLRSGQLAALLATLRDGVAYAQAVSAGSSVDLGPIPAPLPMFVGMLAALAVLLDAGMRRLSRRTPISTRGRGDS